MKKDCVLIATLPGIRSRDPRHPDPMHDIEVVFSNPYIAEARFNTGAATPFSIEETLTKLKAVADKYGKKLWIDLKGRQLRITRWADPLYECIEVSHKVKVSLPAEIHLRNAETTYITNIVDGNKLFVNPPPKFAVGAGQSVNIVADDIEIEGYLTPKDKKYLVACRKLGINNIMASFVEQEQDLKDIRRLLPKAEIVSKIESLKGIEYISNNEVSNLMAARDDLYTQCGGGPCMIPLLKKIIERDPNAICASKIFMSLEKRESADLADFEDLELMYSVLGYRRFMLCDNICNYRFYEAIDAWKEFIHG